MKKIRLGTKSKNISYKFRETCFGIVEKDNEFYVTEKDGEISLIGGVEEKETQEETLKREFMEEVGLIITKINPFITIDCYWFTRDGHDRNSLANFYIIEVSERIKEPTEKCSKLVKKSSEEIKNQLALPYQKKAMEYYLEKK